MSHYRNLYIENRADALEALDSLPQLKHVHSLKAKILFSMIVVSEEFNQKFHFSTFLLSLNS